MNRRCPAKKLWNMISPWGEGAPFSARRTIQTHRLSTARCALYPLPEGEGQGEGKRRELPSRVSDHSRNCRTGRVLRQSRRFPEMTMNPALLLESALPNGVVSSIFLFLGPGRRYLVA